MRASPLSKSSAPSRTGLLARILSFPLVQFRGEGEIIGPREPESVFVREPEPPLMPQTWDEYVWAADSDAKTILEIEIATVKRTGRAMNHVLAYGPAGSGKTSLAFAAASEVGAVVYESSGAEFPDQRSLLLAFASIGRLHRQTGKAVHWVVEEADAIPRVASYVLHSLAQNNYVTLDGQKYGDVKLTLWFNTNHVARIQSSALRDRFPIQIKLGLMSPEALARVAEIAARKRGLRLHSAAAELLGLNGAGNPRQITMRILPALLNIMEDRHFVTVEDARRGLQAAGIRPGGLVADQVAILEFLDRVGSASLATIGAHISEPNETVEELCRYLVTSSAISVGPRGRSATSTGKAYVAALKGGSAEA